MLFTLMQLLSLFNTIEKKLWPFLSLSNNFYLFEQHIGWGMEQLDNMISKSL
jgi:hypothetical protein